MKLFIFLVLIFLAAAEKKYNVREDIAEQWEEIYEPYKEECIQESGVKEEDVRDMFKRGHYPNDRKFKCYLKCAGIKMKYLTEDGTINEAIIRKNIKAADLDIANSIKSVEHIKDPCEKYYLYITTAVSKIAVKFPPQNI